jgi:flagellar hook-associated protein 3 FlgL
MRIAQRTIYNNMLNNMQFTLGAYMESNIQGSSQKKVNRPSDDPAGTARIMNYRASLEMNKQQRYNADTADGWLKLGDETLMQVSTVISRLKELAEQAATGTYSPENRLQMSFEIRAQFEQLINLANTKFEDQHIFGGHKYLDPAYEMGLGITTGDPDLKYDSVNWKVDGGTDRSIMVRFPEDITINDTGTPTPAGAEFEWSDDGGMNWHTGVIDTVVVPRQPAVLGLDTTVNILQAGGAQITIPQPAPGATITFKAYDPIKAANPEDFNGFFNGSQLIIRPAAYYMGDDNDPDNPNARNGLPQAIEGFGNFPTAYPNCTSTGNFSGDVRIRIEPDPYSTVSPPPSTYTPGQTMYYSYSTDNGLTWTPAHTTVADPAVNPGRPTRLIVPGGFLDLNLDTAAGAPPELGQIDVGQQFIIRPHRAMLEYEIMPGQYMSVNNVGKDIFGGLYQTTAMKYPYYYPELSPHPYQLDPDHPHDPKIAAQPVFGDGDARNLFEVVSRLIAFTECNNQNGVQQCLEDLTTAHQTVMTAAAKIGGKENRLAITKQVLGYQKLDKEERLSYVEDVDLTELLSRLAQQELAYSTVLKSSAMIMQLNLTKFI